MAMLVMMRRVMGLASVMVVTVAALTVPGVSAQAVGETMPATRILLYGDSITQGSSGDWTWRYFVDRHLREHHVKFDFVGPRSGLHRIDPLGAPASEPGTNDEEYADGAFDRDHGAVWGQAISLPTYRLASKAYDETSLVREFDPDVVVSMIGLNDLTWLGQTPGEVIMKVRAQVEAARSISAHVDVVLVPYPNTWFGGVEEFNVGLAALATEMDTTTSRVVAAPSLTFYPAVDTWDGNHPSTHGSVKIAYAVETALAQIGLGEAPTSMPIVPDGGRQAPGLTAVPGSGQVELAWGSVPGLLEQWIEVRDVSAATPWARLPASAMTSTSTATVAGLVDGHRYEFRLRGAKGSMMMLTAAEPVSAIPGARPEPPVPTVRQVDGSGRVVVSWPAVARASGYRVEVTLREQHGQRRVRTWAEPAAGSSWSVRGLAPGATVAVRVRADLGELVGPWSGSVRAAVPHLAAVRSAKARSPRRDRVATSAKGVVHASAYRLETAGAASCRRQPANRRFVAHGRDLAAPKATVRTKRAVLWVRWRAVRAGVPGPVGPTSLACTRVR